MIALSGEFLERHSAAAADHGLAVFRPAPFRPAPFRPAPFRPALHDELVAFGRAAQREVLTQAPRASSPAGPVACPATAAPRTA